MSRKSEVLEVEGRKITVSNFDRVLYPAAKFRKGQIIDYYVRVSSYLLPHLRDRPVTLKRYPDGTTGEFFYEKDAPSFTPDWVKRFAVSRRGRAGQIHYILVNDLATLVWVANIASLEIHPFLHRAPEINQPTSVVFDFDPGHGADILTCAKAALVVRDLLHELHLRSFPKVSGSKGLQVYVPLNRKVDYGLTSTFAKAVAQIMEQRHPSWILSKMAKELRPKKVFIDWSQNSDYKTTVSVYSLRAKSNRPYVSLPLTWDELSEALDRKRAGSLYFEPEAALERVTRVHDLFEPVLTMRQDLPSTALDGERLSKSISNSLKTYRDKRDFTKTPEPGPSLPQASEQGSRRRFVIQKHAASHLHYDFRLEMHGVLKSWAVPKGPALSTDIKRLAMATEDHPLEYLDFEGVIPKGQYGGGTVMVWDIGTYELIEGNYYKGYLNFYLQGRKLKGKWNLTKSRENGDARQNKWYLQKIEATLPALSEKLETQSAISGRTMTEIAEARDRQWHSNRDEEDRLTQKQRARNRETKNRGTAIDLETLPAARLEFVPPMLAKSVLAAPEGTNWQYEIKLDGYRALMVKKDGRAMLFSRLGNRLNERFPSIVGAFAGLVDGTTLDGEIVALDTRGRPRFNALQHAKGDGPLYFYAFDILAYRGKDVTKLPLSSRRACLEEAINGLDDPVRLSPKFEFAANDIVHAARKQGLEGIIAKRTDSRYEVGKRSGAWVKYKTAIGQELVVGGYLPGPHGFDSLLVGYYEDSKLVFLGKVKNGFTPALRRRIATKFEGLESDKCPFTNLPEPKTARRGKALTKEVMKECQWLRPQLVAQVEFTEWTSGNHLRHSRFVGLRDDKDPREVRKEETAAMQRIA